MKSTAKTTHQEAGEKTEKGAFCLQRRSYGYCCAASFVVAALLVFALAASSRYFLSSILPVFLLFFFFFCSPRPSRASAKSEAAAAAARRLSRETSPSSSRPSSCARWRAEQESSEGCPQEEETLRLHRRVRRGATAWQRWTSTTTRRTCSAKGRGPMESPPRGVWAAQSRGT